MRITLRMETFTLDDGKMGKIDDLGVYFLGPSVLNPDKSYVKFVVVSSQSVADPATLQPRKCQHSLTALFHCVLIRYLL